MASLRYRDPTTGNWVLLNEGGTVESQILFFKTKADFPDVGADPAKLYIDTSDSRTYIFTPGFGYNLVGDGYGDGLDWNTI